MWRYSIVRWVVPSQERENVEYVLAIEQALFDASNGTKLIPTTANPALLPVIARRAADPYVHVVSVCHTAADGVSFFGAGAHSGNTLS